MIPEITVIAIQPIGKVRVRDRVAKVASPGSKWRAPGSHGRVLIWWLSGAPAVPFGFLRPLFLMGQFFRNCSVWVDEVMILQKHGLPLFFCFWEKRVVCCAFAVGRSGAQAPLSPTRRHGGHSAGPCRGWLPAPPPVHARPPLFSLASLLPGPSKA